MFNSFYLAGFECGIGYNKHRQWFDQTAATQHDRFVDEDYARIKSIGIRAAREAVRWPLVDRKEGYDFSTVVPFLEASRRHGLDIVWDLFHFGYPPALDLFSPEFPERFADYCYAAARVVQRRSNGAPLYFTPINEPSFLSWAAGDAALFPPYCNGAGFDLKVALVRAAIKGIDAIWSAAPGARIVNVDSLCRVVAPPVSNDRIEQEVAFFNEHAVFQSWDMLAGRLLPELGGSPKHLDIVGVNYYWTNQWQIDQVGAPLDCGDGRCWSLGRLVRWAHERTGHPILITETGHVGDHRVWWMNEVAESCKNLLRDRIPLLGACLYPILGMPEWHEPDVWTRMGLWDLLPDATGNLMRVPYEPAMEAFQRAAASISGSCGSRSSAARPAFGL